jgi:hypothetical protein
MSTLFALLVVGQIGEAVAAPQELRLDVPVARPVAVELVNGLLAPAPPVETAPPRPIPAAEAPVAAAVAAPPMAPPPAGSYESDGCKSDGYVSGLYCQAYADCPDGSGGSCPSCWNESGKDDGCLCKLHSTCDLYPHYAYYPKYHGYYYFRPYNYQMIAEHQRFAACIGLDPRMPYSLSVFDRVYANFTEKYTPTHGPIGTALPQGSGLPLLEDLLAEGPVPAEPTPVPPAPPVPQ